PAAACAQRRFARTPARLPHLCFGHEPAYWGGRDPQCRAIRSRWRGRPFSTASARRLVRAGLCHPVATGRRSSRASVPWCDRAALWPFESGSRVSGDPGLRPPEGTGGAQDGDLADVRRWCRVLVALAEPISEPLRCARLVQRGERNFSPEAILQAAERIGVDPPRAGAEV